MSVYGKHFDGLAWPWSLDGSGGWYALHDATGRYVSDAEMRELAQALRAGTRMHAKRCAAWIENGAWHLCSPRNTMGGSATLPLGRAVELADIIERALDEGEPGAAPERAQ